MRVARDAVAAHAGARHEPHEAERLGGGGVDHLGDVQLEDAARVGDLVDERDVHRPERVLEQLRHLGGRCRRDGVYRGAVPGHRLGGLAAALRRDAADDAGHRLVRMGGVARVDALRAEHHEHVLAGPQSPLAQRLGEKVTGTADIGRRGQHQDLPRYRVRHHRLAGPAQDAQVGDQVIVDRRRYADDDRARPAQSGRLRGELEGLGVGGGEAQAFPVGLEQVDAPPADVIQARGVDVDADHPVAGRVERECGGQSDVPESDDRDVMREVTSAVTEGGSDLIGQQRDLDGRELLPGVGQYLCAVQFVWGHLGGLGHSHELSRLGRKDRAGQLSPLGTERAVGQTISDERCRRSCNAAGRQRARE